MGFGSLLGLATKLFSSTGPSQSTIQRAGVEEKPAALEQVNLAVSQKELKQLNAPEQIATAPIIPEVLQDNKADPLNAIKQQGEAAPAIKLEISQKAVETLKPILSAFKDLVKSLLLGNKDTFKDLVKNFLLRNEDTFNLVKNFLLNNEGTFKPILLNLSQENSKPVNTQASPNPA